jgi:hypothetical protein
MREPPWAADLTNIPELHEILRRRLLSKVRIFEGWCENGDRLFQVVKVHGRPLALAEVMSVAATGSPNPRRAEHAEHRSNYQAAWLDLSWDAYVARIPGRRVTPYLLNAQCQHEHLPVPLDWLREQVSTGVSKCVITPAVRLEMGRRRRVALE